VKKLIIFDMGNTLLDFHKGPYTDEAKDMIGLEAMRDYLYDNHQVQVSLKDLKDHFLDPWYGDFYKRDLLVELDVRVYVKALFKTLNLDCPVDYYLLMKAFYSQYMKDVCVNEGALDLLKALDGDYKIGVISNCILFDDLYKEVFVSKGLDAYIDHYIFSYSRQIRKPDPRLFQECLDHFQVAAGEAVMVGDSLKADMAGAKQVGMTTIWYKDTDHETDLVDYKIKKLIECIGVMKDGERKV